MAETLAVGAVVGSDAIAPGAGARPALVTFDGPCPFLMCLKQAPHTHPVCPGCGAVRFGNLFCETCRAHRGEALEEMELGRRLLAGEAVCAGCLCTEERACPGGCAWYLTRPFVCTRCASLPGLADQIVYRAGVRAYAS